jgi:hypothetical protein
MERDQFFFWDQKSSSMGPAPVWKMDSNGGEGIDNEKSIKNNDIISVLWTSTQNLI